jgi:hypothetical protein
VTRPNQTHVLPHGESLVCVHESSDAYAYVATIDQVTASRHSVAFRKLIVMIDCRSFSLDQRKIERLDFAHARERNTIVDFNKRNGKVLTVRYGPSPSERCYFPVSWHFPQPCRARGLEANVGIKATGHGAVDDGLLLLVQQHDEPTVSMPPVPQGPS